MKTQLWILLVLTNLMGCSQSNTSKPQAAVNEREAGQAWDQFISKAKSKKKDAQSAWERKYDKGELKIEFLRDDVKLDPARGAMIGEVDLKTSEWTIVSYKNKLPDGGFGKGSGHSCEYKLRFRYSAGVWKFMDGSCKAAQILYGKLSEPSTSGVETLDGSSRVHLAELFKQ